jgi:uncharacterized Zn-binding protein involved in type VI secretion
MPGLARKDGIDTIAAPDGTPGTPCVLDFRCDAPSTQYTDEGSSTVFVGNPPYGVVRFGDKMTPHTTIPCGCPIHIPPMVVCSSFIFVEGKRLARKGDEYVADGVYHPISSADETVVDGSPKS